MTKILKFAVAVSLLLASAIVTTRLVEYPSAVLLVLMSGALGWLLAAMSRLATHAQRDYIRSDEVARSLAGFRALANGQQSADRYARMDELLANYVSSLQGSEEGR